MLLKEKVANNAQCNGKAATILMEFQGRPPVGRGRCQVPGGPGGEDMSECSAAGSQLKFQLSWSPYIPAEAYRPEARGSKNDDTPAGGITS